MSKASLKGKLPARAVVPLTPDDWWRVAATAQTTIRQRSQEQGLDKTGRPFARYTPRYAKRKAKSGCKTSPVDLTWTGNLWRAWGVREQRDWRVALGFLTRPEQRKAAGLLQKRDFLGLTPAEEKALGDLLLAAFAAKQARRRR